MNWISIATIDAVGNSSSTHDYHFVDESIKSKQFYYRLKQTDIDGKITYSDVVAVNNCMSNTEISVFPNPTTNGFYISPIDVQASFCELFDMQGKLLRKMNLTKSNYMSMQEFANGVYLLKIYIPNQDVQIVKIEKQ